MLCKILSPTAKSSTQFSVIYSIPKVRAKAKAFFQYSFQKMTLYMYLFIETLITVHTFIYSLSKCIFKTKMMVSNYNEIYLSFQCRVPIFCFAIEQICICCFCSVSQSCLTLCNPKNGSMPGFPVFTVSQSCSNSCPLSW